MVNDLGSETVGEFRLGFEPSPPLVDIIWESMRVSVA